MNNNRPDWYIYFMIQAVLASLRSNCLTRKVGAVLVKDNRVISTGYNGTPSGITNCFDGGCTRCARRKAGEIGSGESLDTCLCVHAEINTVLQSKLDLKGTDLYCTLLPCLSCTKILATIGVEYVYFMGTYNVQDDNNLKMMNDLGIQTILVDREDIQFWMEELKNV